MVKHCCIKYCKSQSVSGCGISFHRIPKNAECGQKWIDVIPGCVSKYSVVCNLHFKPDDFTDTCYRKTLKLNAVPSIFPVKNSSSKVKKFASRNTSRDAMKPNKSVKFSVPGQRARHLHQVLGAKVKTKAAPNKSPVVRPRHGTPKIKSVKLAKIPISKPKTATPKKPTAAPKPAAKTSVKSPAKPTLNPIAVDATNVEYECPKCMKSFRNYFSAHRHIQKCHCVNSAGEKVPPNSPHLIKPITRQLCPKCNKRIMANKTHSCENNPDENEELGPAMYYVCSGCKEQFISLKLFDKHVSGLHYLGVESMFLPSKEDFQEWKNEMEKLINVRYAILGKYSSKEMYRCTFLPDGTNIHDDTTSVMCPSTIVVREFSKGVQVHFYKDHHGHSSNEYVLPDKYKKFSLTTILQNAEGYTQINELKVDENDPYLQFKKLMECIVLDAAKINIKTLKVLIGKALEMTSVLNNYEEDSDSDTMSQKKVIEEKISWVVNNKSVGEKRKPETPDDKSKSEPITKRFKTRMYQHPPEGDKAKEAGAPAALQDTTIKIINSFSLADKDISKAVNEMDSEGENDTKPKINTKGDGGTSPLPELSVSRDELMTPIKFQKEAVDSSLTSFNDSYKDFVSKNFKMSPTVPSKSKSKSAKNLPKKFTLSKGSKTDSSPSPPLPQMKQRLSDASLSKPIDYKYEVKERENDCNILILKI
ncbi:unnamed protein product, partial [Iphiclides podalirius]